MPLAVILTSLPIEYLAVRNHLTDLREEIHPQGIIYERGLFITENQTWEVGIAEVGAGNTSQAVEAERTIAYFQPDILLLVGISSGIKDVSIGDVVTSTRVYGYESAKKSEEFSTRPTIGQCTYSLIQRAKSEARKGNWTARILRNNEQEKQPQVFVAPIVMGDKVIASRNSSLFLFLRSNYQEAIAVDVQNISFIRVAFAYPNIQSIVIRGIADLIEGKYAHDPIEGGQEERQEKASRHASAFAFEILSKVELTNSHTIQEKFIETTQKSSIRNLTNPSFFAYDDGWVGRKSLIQKLGDRIRGNCRLLMLFGITGIGKTALGERLAIEVSDWLGNDWSHYHRENFDNEQQSSDFCSVAARWLEKWGKFIAPDERKAPQWLLSQLLNHMQENRCLVQIDSLENILQGNEEEGCNDFKDEWWLNFFTGYLKTDSCQSCFILTTQDIPTQLEEVGSRYQNFWHFQALHGLEKEEKNSLFRKQGIDLDQEPNIASYLERISNVYEGHPLALRIIASEIRNPPFNGNVLSYWNRYSSEIVEIEKGQTAANDGEVTGIDMWRLEYYTKPLRRNVKFRLEKMLDRLKVDNKWAYILLCETSVYRTPVPEDFWLSHLEDWKLNRAQQIIALESLEERCLVERVIKDNEILVRQNNLIRSISLKHLQRLDDSRT